MSDYNKRLILRYVKENGYLDREMYQAVLLSLDLKENGISVSMSNAVAYGKHLIGETAKIDVNVYNQLVSLSKNIWRLRNMSTKEEEDELHCPLCHRPVRVMQEHVVCENNLLKNKRSCPFYFPRTFVQHTFNEEEIKLLLEGKVTPVITDFQRKDQTTFQARVYLNKENKLEFYSKKKEQK